MAISEKKMQIVIDNYFKSECNVDTSIRDAFEKGFRIGVQKTANRPKGEWRIDKYGIYHCPFCHAINNTVYKSFCPNCGADMRGEVEE